MLSQQTRATVKATVPVLVEHGETITTHFYKTLFADYPDLKNIFNAKNQAQGQQPRALAHAVLAAAQNIDDWSVLQGTVELVAHKHRSLQVKPEHYPIVGEYLLRAIKDVLGDAATDDIITAWGETYGALAQVFIDAEKALYEETEQQQGGWEGFQPFLVSKIIRESEEVTTFEVDPIHTNTVASFTPGQYITVRVKAEEGGYWANRHYSLTSLSGDSSYRFSVKKEQKGDVSQYLHDNVKVGDKIELSAPAGTFAIDMESNEPIVFIGGGVGATPLFAMLQAIKLHDPNHSVTWIQTARSLQVMAFKGQVESLVAEMPNANAVFGISDATTPMDESVSFTGHITKELLERFLPEGEFNVALCGPVAMIGHVSQLLGEIGVSESRIFTEQFGPMEPIGV